MFQEMEIRAKSVNIAKVIEKNVEGMRAGGDEGIYGLRSRRDPGTLVRKLPIFRIHE